MQHANNLKNDHGEHSGSQNIYFLFTSCLIFLFFFICSRDVSFMLAPYTVCSEFLLCFIVLMAAGKVRGHKPQSRRRLERSVWTGCDCLCSCQVKVRDTCLLSGTDGDLVWLVLNFARWAFLSCKSRVSVMMAADELLTPKTCLCSSAC